MIEEDGLQANSQRVGDVFLREMLTLRDEFEIVGDVRGRGLMLGIEMVKNKVTPVLIISSTCGHVFKAEMYLYGILFMYKIPVIATVREARALQSYPCSVAKECKASVVDCHGLCIFCWCI